MKEKIFKCLYANSIDIFFLKINTTDSIWTMSRLWSLSQVHFYTVKMLTSHTTGINFILFRPFDWMPAVFREPN